MSEGGNGRFAARARRGDHPVVAFPLERAAREPRPGGRYLVTGCAGFIGSHLTEALAADGCSVVGVDAFTDNYPRSIKQRNLEQCGGGLTFAELDLADEPLGDLLDGVDGVFHLAARPGVRTSWGSTFDVYVRDNLLATQRVFEAAVERGIRVVYASSSSVYGQAESYPLREDAKPVPVSPYGVSKLACEALAGSYALSRGLDAVGLRYFSVYGPRQRPDMAFAAVFDCLARGLPFRMFGTGSQMRDFTFAGDVVDATLAAMRQAPAGGIYNVGGGCEVSLLESLALCEEIVGRRLEIEQVGSGTGDARRTLADYGRAADDLGWAPKTSLEDGLRAQAECAAAFEPDEFEPDEPLAVAEAV